MSDKVCLLCYDKVFSVYNNLTLPAMEKLVKNCHNHLPSTLFPATHSTDEMDPNDFSLCQRCMESAINFSDVVEEFESCKKELSNSADKLSDEVWQRRFNKCLDNVFTPDLTSNSAVGENDNSVDTSDATMDNEASVVNEQLANSGRSGSMSNVTDSGSIDESSSILSEEISSSNEQTDNDDYSEDPKCSRGDVGTLAREKIKLQTVQLKNYLKDERKRKKERNRRFQCLHCSKVFCSAWELKNHVRIHTGEKPFKCLYCTKTSNSSSGLNEHLRVHTGEKPYKCSTCGYDFAILSSARRHAKLHTGEKAYECKCGKKFMRKDNMKNHLRVRRHELRK